MSYPKFKTVSTLGLHRNNEHDKKLNDLSEKGWVIISGLITNGEYLYSMMVYDEAHPITQRAIQRGRLEKEKSEQGPDTKVKPIAEA